MAGSESGGSTATTVSSAADGSTAPGVSSDAITIGFGISDLSVIGALGPGYDQGDPQQHIEAILAELREDGSLPVHGRDIRPVFSSYNILSADEQRATCEAFGQDTTVFAVMALTFFGAGNECTAREFGLPTLTSDGQADAVYERSAPNLFSLQLSADRLFRNFVAWAHRDGLLRGRRIGVYYSAEPEAAKVVDDNVIAPIRALGHDIVSTVQTSEVSTGGPTDSVAVQRFVERRVDTAVLLVSPIAKTNFFNQAEAQGYRPRYLENDAASSTTDTATSTYPRAHFDGAAGFTAMRFGEANSGLPEAREAAWCRAAIRQHAGNDIPRRGRDAEYISANKSCDGIRVIVRALELAGRDLTRPGFVRALESLRGFPAGVHADISFSPKRHDGASTWRRLDWTAACSCWRVRTPMRPMRVE